MSQPDHSHRGPKRRGDSTRPPSAGSRARRGGDRRPYPTASTTTSISSAKPGSARVRSRTRGSASTPTPATVWTAGPAPIDLDTAWPGPIVSKIVASFSGPGARVVLLPWPTPGDHQRLASGVTDRPSTTTPGAEPDEALAEVRASVEGLDRTARVVRVPADSTPSGPGSRPFWADLVGGPDNSFATATSPGGSDFGGRVLGGTGATPADTDLIITSLPPEHGGGHASDHVALLAAGLLRVGGILVVLTHCDWPAGELIDPTGAMVASAQNADLLYLQHVVALHTPVRDGQLAPELLDGVPADERKRTRHRAAVRGLPAPHRRIHSDVLVFAQPHEYEPPHLSTAEQAFETGVIR